MLRKKTLVILSFLALMFMMIGSVDQKMSKYRWIDVAEHIYLVTSENWHGTGFAVQDDEGRVFIVTNRHVCGFQGVPLKIKDYLGNEYQVTKRWLSRNTDLCAIEAPANAVPLKMAASVEVGTEFITAGYPLVRFMQQNKGHVIGFSEEPTWIGHSIPEELSEAQCKEVGQIIGDMGPDGKPYLMCKIELKDVAVTDLFIGGGASGSPIIDTQTHEVIGVLFGGRQVGYSLVLGSFIKIDTLRAFLKAIR
jgi:S1-C subfamily serine protease